MFFLFKMDLYRIILRERKDDTKQKFGHKHQNLSTLSHLM